MAAGTDAEHSRCSHRVNASLSGTRLNRLASPPTDRQHAARSRKSRYGGSSPPLVIPRRGFGQRPLSVVQNPPATAGNHRYLAPPRARAQGCRASESAANRHVSARILLPLSRIGARLKIEVSAVRVRLSPSLRSAFGLAQRSKRNLARERVVYSYGSNAAVEFVQCLYPTGRVLIATGPCKPSLPIDREHILLGRMCGRTVGFSRW